MVRDGEKAKTMAEIIGFQGVRYDTARAGGPLTALVAPPYDVITPAEQDALYAQNPHNIVRLTLGREQDKYALAARVFREWLAQGVLVKDDDEAVYVVRQSFQDPSTQAACPERVGLACLLKLEEYEAGTVLPHENTLAGAKADRLALMRATEAQFEPIFGLYSDPDRAVQSFLGEWDDREPALETVPDAIGSSHAVERIGEDGALETLQALMRDKQIFIADGHHRYETALQYRREVRQARGVPPDAVIPEDYIFLVLTAFEDEGLLVLPTHRLVQGAAAEKISGLPQLLAEDFVLEPVSEEGAGGASAQSRRLELALAGKAKQGQVAFGVLLPNGKSLLATWKGQTGANGSQSAGQPAVMLDRLPVSLLHSLILDKQLGIGAEALALGGQVTYTRDGAQAWAQVQEGKAQAGFLLARPTVDEVRDVSLSGGRMPQKSTFFFPKLLSGLLMRDLRP